MRDRALKIGIIFLIAISVLFCCTSSQMDRKTSKLAEAYLNLGTDYLKEGEYDEAISVVNKALEINPNYAEDNLNRGIAYIHKNQHDQAISADDGMSRESEKH